MKVSQSISHIFADKKNRFFAAICVAIVVIACIACFTRVRHIDIEPAPVSSESILLENGAEIKQVITPSDRELKDIRVTLTNADRAIKGDLNIAFYKNGSLLTQWNRKTETIKGGVYIFNLPQEVTVSANDVCYVTFCVTTPSDSPISLAVTEDMVSRVPYMLDGKAVAGKAVAVHSSYQSDATRKLDMLNLVFYLAAALLIVALAFLLIYKKPKIEVLITVLVFVIGLFFMILMTPMSIPDEPHHYQSAFQLSNAMMFRFDSMEYGEAEYFDYTNIVPHHNRSSGYMRVFADLGEPAEGTSELIKIPQPRKLTYFVEYIPQATGITLGRVFGFNFITTFMLGRFFSLLFYTACVYLALKKIPKFKLPLGLVAMMPMILHQAASYSYDSFVNGMSLLLIACIMRHILAEEPVRTADLITIGIVGALLTPAKVIYCPIMFLLFFIPKERFGGNMKKKLLILVALAAVCLIVMMTFQLPTMLEMNSRGTTKLNHEGKYNYTVSDILKNPVHAFSVFLGTFVQCWDVWLLCAIGYSMSGLSLALPLWIPIGFLLLLILSTVSPSDNPITLKTHQRLITTAIAFGIVILVMLSMFIAWTSNTSPAIQGVQGRYFIPIIPLILLGLSSHKSFALQRNIDRQMIFAAVFLNLSALVYIIQYTITN